MGTFRIGKNERMVPSFPIGRLNKVEQEVVNSIPEAPSDGTTYGRKNKTWTTVTGGTPASPSGSIQFNNYGSFGGVGSTDGSTYFDFNALSLKNFFISKTGDTTAKFAFDVGNLSTGTIRTLTVPNRSLILDNITTSTTSNGTGFIKSNGTSVTFDNSTYLTSLSGALLADGTVTGATTQAQTFTNGGIFSNATVSTIAGFDSSKKLITLDTGTYPSLTELSYVKGVTSAIQTQLNGKQASGTYVTGATNTTLTLTSTTLGLNLSNANTWLAKQTFSTSNISITGGANTNVLSTDGSGNLSWVAASGGAVSSVSNSDGTLTISPTTGSVVASLALGHANTWTALQKHTLTSEQLRLGYDSSNYLSFTTGSAGSTVFNAVGTTPSFVFQEGGVQKAGIDSSGFLFQGTGSGIMRVVTLSKQVANASIGAYIELGTFSATNGGHSFMIQVVNNQGYTGAKTYNVSTYYAKTFGAWVILTPSSSSGMYVGTEDFAIDMNSNANDTKFRLRRVAGGGLYCDIVIYYNSSNGNTFTPSSTTGIDSTITTRYTGTVIGNDIDKAQLTGTLANYGTKGLLIGNATSGILEGMVDQSGQTKRQLYHNQYSIQRTIPLNANDAVDIGSFYFTNGTALLDIELSIPASGYSQSKRYIFPVQYKDPSTGWQIILPLYTTGSYTGNDAKLEINIDRTQTYLRIRRVSTDGVHTGVANLIIKQQGVETDVFTESTTVNTVSAPTSYYLPSSLTQDVSGVVGVGVEAPSAKLHVIYGTEQLRVGYDTSNYLSTTVNSTGSATFALTGTTPTFTFSQQVNATKVKATTAGGYISSDGSTGYTGTVTTASLVGKTITIKDGIITGFA